MKCRFFFMYFRMPFSKPIIVPRATKLVLFLFIMLGNRNLSHAGWTKMGGNEENVFHHGKKSITVLGPFWSRITMLQVSDEQFDPTWQGRIKCWGLDIWIPGARAPCFTSGGSADIGWHARSGTPDPHCRRDTNLNHHCHPLSPLFLSEPISIQFQRNHQPMQRGNPKGTRTTLAA